MKKFLSLLVVLILAVGLCACGNTGASSTPSTTPAPSASSAGQTPAATQDAAAQSNEPEVTWP
ncbi:MAG: transporter, partial [Clostridiales bacterium]|nr:transporter [Clostridiales bacterium]